MSGEILTQEQMMTRRDYAELVFKDLKETERVTFEVAAGYGRWLLGSLVLIQGGALFGMFTFLGQLASHPELLSQYQYAIWWLVAGLLMALCSGFLAWVNWSMISANYGYIANTEMLWNPKSWVGDPVHTWGIDVTNWACVILGFISAFCIVGAADAIVNRAQLFLALTSFWS